MIGNLATVSNCLVGFQIHVLQQREFQYSGELQNVAFFIVLLKNDQQTTVAEAAAYQEPEDPDGFDNRFKGVTFIDDPIGKN